MLEKVYELGLQKCAGDKEQAQQFVEAFVETVMEKQAMAAPQRREFSPYESLVGGLASELGKGIGGLTLNVGVTGISNISRMLQNGALKNNFHAALEKAVATNSLLRQADKHRVQEYAETIFKFAPNVATDANLLSSLLANAIHGEGIDPMTIKTLAELENRIKDNKAFNPKSYV